MAEQTRSKLIEEHSIGKGLDGFRASFSTVCEGLGIACEPDALARLAAVAVSAMINVMAAAAIT